MSDNTPELSPGLTGETSVVVHDDLTAAALGSGNVNVYATPSLIALLEEAAVKALKDHLPPGMTSVGTLIDVRHMAATPVNMIVTARPTLREVDGRRLVFDVSAWDTVERISEGTHERFIVKRDSFEKRAASKIPG